MDVIVHALTHQLNASVFQNPAAEASADTDRTVDVAEIL